MKLNIIKGLAQFLMRNSGDSNLKSMDTIGKFIRESENEHLKGPNKTAFVMNSLIQRPEFFPIRVIILTYLGTSIAAWIGSKQISKLVTRKDWMKHKKIQTEFIRSHTAKQKQLLDQIKRLESEKGSLTNKFKNVVKGLMVDEISDLAGSYSLSHQMASSSKSNFKYSAILTRKYEDSLSNYQLTLYKTLVEFETRILFKSRALRILLVIAVPMLATLVASKLINKDRTNKLSDVAKGFSEILKQEKENRQ